jgi:twitching motility protein PilT
MHIFDGLLDDMLVPAWQAGASDLLLISESKPFVRVDGALARLDDQDAVAGSWMHDVLEATLDDRQQNGLRDHKEVDFAFSWRDVARVRGNAFIQQGSPTIALRFIPNRIPGYAELGIPDAVQELATKSQGLVLFTGPTGSGKSTSLASLVDWINTNRPCHILTIEDPVEFVHDHKMSAVSQRELGTDTESFARALRAALREDPDVILLGEMRDPESIAIALTLAETGHLVFSTLHTNDAAQALDRIVDVSPPGMKEQIRVQLAGSLSGVIAQRLLPRIGGGMVAAYEVLLANNAVRNLVLEGKTRQLRNVMTTAQIEGMQTLEMSMSALLLQGTITYEDAVQRSTVPKEIAVPLPAPALALR